MRTVTCDVCGKKGARVRRVTRSYSKGKQEFLIRGIPVVGCPNCGESYLTAETLREVERIKLHHNQLTVKQTVPVAQFGGKA
jgi:YgiT-type zinc finger domain-containing protein